MTERRGIQTEAEWQHAGLKCYILKHPEMGAYNGYVILPAGHPDHGKGYDDIEVEVHGGLTYAAWESGRRNGGPWTVGFDTLHSQDWAAWRPGPQPGAILWTLLMVRVETSQLAEQPAAHGPRTLRRRSRTPKRPRAPKLPTPNPSWVEL